MHQKARHEATTSLKPKRGELPTEVGGVRVSDDGDGRCAGETRATERQIRSAVTCPE